MAAKKSGLGRGLDALFPEKTVHSKQEEKPVQKAVSADDEKEKETETAGSGIKTVKISKVEPNREQPRKKFDEDALLELSESIKQYGILQPLLVSDKKDYYELISEGLEINCIAEIKDYYFDKNGVIVIEQELASDELLDCEVYESLVSDMETELEALRPILNERYQIELCDVRGANYGVINNKMKVFDFGLSSGSGLFDYGSYSEECDDSWEDEYESSDEYWDSDHSNY